MQLISILDSEIKMNLCQIIVIVRKAQHRLFFILTGFFIFVFCSGCSTSSYLVDRMHDASDIFTATVGQNYGVKARIGPLRAGLFCGLDYAGLRSGEWGVPFHPKGYEQAIDLELTLFSHETFLPDDLLTARHRGKLFSSEGIICFSMPDEMLNTSYRQQATYYTQIEAAVGLWGGIRLGFNPGELLDFLLGWATIDLYQDDLANEKDNPLFAS